MLKSVKKNCAGHVCRMSDEMWASTYRVESRTGNDHAVDSTPTFKMTALGVEGKK